MAGPAKQVPSWISSVQFDSISFSGRTQRRMLSRVSVRGEGLAAGWSHRASLKPRAEWRAVQALPQ